MFVQKFWFVACVKNSFQPHSMSNFVTMKLCGAQTLGWQRLIILDCWLVKLSNAGLLLALSETVWMNISKLFKHLSGITLTGFVVWQNFCKMLKTFLMSHGLYKCLIISIFSVAYHLCSPAQALPRQTQSYLRCCCFCSGQGDPAICKYILVSNDNN